MSTKKLLYSLGIVAVIVALIAGGLSVALAGGPGSAQPVAASTAQQTGTRSITVVGTGKVTGKPDIGRLTVGVETQAPLLQTIPDTVLRPLRRAPGRARPSPAVVPLFGCPSD